MAKQVQLKAKTRTETGRGPVKRLRSTGVVPGVVYGRNTKPLSVTVDIEELGDVLAHAIGGNVLVDLKVETDGKTVERLALIQEVQHHPVRDEVLHVDFREVSATEKMRTTVAVRPVGEPAGVKTGGGTLEFVVRELNVECLPKDLPDVIEINVEQLEIGQSVNVGSLTPPAGVTLLDPKERAVFTVAAPMAEEVEATAEAGPGEPEVIGEKKEEGEEGEAAADGKPAAPGKPEAGKAEAKPAAGAAPAKGAAAAAPAKGAAPAAGAKPAAAAKPEAKKK
ncbi:MAG: 50S ribosomal protein L25 [Verrucomicrobia bacterium]|nr:50S ribosomal protein L25 [Verrucomicrobiota bacterium]